MSALVRFFRGYDVEKRQMSCATGSTSRHHNGNSSISGERQSGDAGALFRRRPSVHAAYQSGLSAGSCPLTSAGAGHAFSGCNHGHRTPTRGETTAYYSNAAATTHVNAIMGARATNTARTAATTATLGEDLVSPGVASWFLFDLQQNEGLSGPTTSAPAAAIATTTADAVDTKALDPRAGRVPGTATPAAIGAAESGRLSLLSPSYAVAGGRDTSVFLSLASTRSAYGRRSDGGRDSSTSGGSIQHNLNASTLSDILPSATPSERNLWPSEAMNQEGGYIVNGAISPSQHFARKPSARQSQERPRENNRVLGSPLQSTAIALDGTAQGQHQTSSTAVASTVTAAAALHSGHSGSKLLDERRHAPVKGSSEEGPGGAQVYAEWMYQLDHLAERYGHV